VIARPRLHEIVDAFSGRRVVVYGDLVLDRFVPRHAQADLARGAGHHPPLREQRDLPGGGANALANVAALGGVPLAVGVVGDDEPGRALLAALAERGSTAATSSSSPASGRSPRFGCSPAALGAEFQVARYDVEDRLSADRARLAGLGPAPRPPRRRRGRRGGLRLRLRHRDRRQRGATARGVAAAALAVADSRFALTALGAVDGATPNLEELAAVSGSMPADDREVAAAAEALRTRLGARFVVATRGSHGLSLIEARQARPAPAGLRHRPGRRRHRRRRHRARDAHPRARRRRGTRRSGDARQPRRRVVVTRLGTATVSPAELHQAIDLAPFVEG